MSAPAYSIIQFLLSQVRTDTDALIGGSVYFYSPGTTSTSGIYIYLDKDGLSLANNPYTLDGDATAQLYAAGSYRIVIKDVNGVTQFDRDNLYFSSGPDYVTQLAIGNYATLAAAVTAIGSSSARLLINEAITIAADLSVPANIILERIEPGSITVNPGVTLTIVATPLSDASQWFLGSGTVSVTGYPRERAWWGEAERIDAGGFYIKAANVLASPYTVQNLSFTATAGSKALTVALKGIDGNAPSSTNPIHIAFRSATATSSVFVLRTVTAATSVVLSSGSSLGLTGGQTSKIYVWAIDYAGTVELALSRQVKWSATELVSTTTEGGAGGADSVTTLYSTTARTNVACRLLGNITIASGGVAGEWDNAPTVIVVTPDSNSRGSWTQQYADDSGEIQDVALGAQYYTLVSNGATSAPTFQQIATGGITDLNVTEAKLGASAVTQAKLKITTAEDSQTIDTAHSNSKTLTDYIVPTGGQYMLGKAFKYSAIGWGAGSVEVEAIDAAHNSDGLSTSYGYSLKHYSSVTEFAGADWTVTSYVRWDYINSSGELKWLFARRDKTTKKILKMNLADNHPCFATSGDPEKTPHPWPGYNPITEEIIVCIVTDEQWEEISEVADKYGDSRLSALVALYEIDEDTKTEWPTKEITIGLPKRVDVGGEMIPIRNAPIGTIVTPVKAAIPRPSGILIKKLIRRYVEEVKG